MTIKRGNKKKKSLKYYKLLVLGLYSLVVAIVIILSLVFYLYERNAENEIFRSRETAKMELADEYTANILDELVADEQILSNLDGLNSFLVNGTDDDRQHMTNEFQTLGVSRLVYDQIRFLNKDGVEEVRLNLDIDSGEMVVVSANELQDKSDRYYFTESIVLDDGEYFISPLDLNIENDEIEFPYKPMIRVASPLYMDGELKGEIVLNYRADEILTIISDIISTDGSEGMLLNENGYYMAGGPEEDLWGFMFEDGQDKTMSVQDPDLWDIVMSGSDKNSFFYNGDLFVVNKIYPLAYIQDQDNIRSTSLGDLNPDDYVWYIISKTSSSVMHKESLNVGWVLLIGNVLFILIVGLVALLLVRSIARQLVSEKRIVELNDILKLLNKILRHDLANRFTAVKNALSMSAKNSNNKYLIESEKSVQAGIDLIKKMKSLEIAVTNSEGPQEISVADSARRASKEFDIDVNINGDAKVKADEALDAVFSNLIENAINHGKTKKVDIEISKAGGGATIKIIDYGTGIPKEIRDRVFEEGFTYGASGNTGLGLYIVQKTIDRYGGKISIENTKPNGATFVIEIPK